MDQLQQAVHVLPQFTSLNRVVLNLVDLYQPAFAFKRLGSGLDLDPALPLAWIDAPQLERALAHLLRSAVKYTGDGGLVVCRTTADGEWLQITIGDSGPQISAERAARLLDGSNDDSGLGLNDCQAIVAAHGGQIAVDTSYSSGAWFVVRLPVIMLENTRLLAELERDKRLQYELVATLSCELRSPLNVIVGYNDLLFDGAFGRLARDQVEILRRVDHSTRELLDMINAMLEPFCLDAAAGSTTTDQSRVADSDGAQAQTAEQAHTERVVAEFTSLALENARLVEKLRETRRAKFEFITTTSHRLRVPLNAIIGYNDLLLDETFGPLSAEQSDVLHQVRKSALALLASISANLDLRRLDATPQR